ncbi:MAG: hypothetical protein VYC34_11840, partial [Planctomycetota bacterium]|nr:hypothetical protein [Planctomycetota bacterium]
GEGILELTGSLTQLGPVAPAGSVAFLATDGFAVLQALAQQTEVSVLSTPTLFCRDKDEGTIQVGGEVPVIRSNIDSSVQVDGNTGIRQEIEYRDTGVILTIQPNINETGEVTLRINQEVTDVVPSVSSGIDSPEFSTRRVETTVTVPHGRTLLLGGIISSSDSDRRRKIPLLGDIPGLGLLFQNINMETDRTELMLAVTPVVINRPHEGAEFLNQFLESAYGVEFALRDFEADLLGDDVWNAVYDAERPQMYPAPPEIESPAPETPEDDQSRLKEPVRPAVATLRKLATDLPDEASETRAVAEFLTQLIALAEEREGS